jgi:hypothetical protein
LIIEKTEMNKIHKGGVFLATDEEGYLIPDTSASKILPPWREAVDYARQIEVRRLGARLHSLYLRGSVPRGTAIPGRSDLDLFAVLFDDQGGSSPPPWPRRELENFRRLFPFVTSVENSHIDLADVHGPFHYYRFVMKVSAVCIHGEDLLPGIAPYKADAPIAEEWFRIFPHLVDLFVKELGESNEEESRKRLCHDMMKGFLRAGMLLVMRRQRGYTRDLYPSYQCFSKHYPGQEPAMRRCLELAVNPASDPQVLLPLVTDLAAWMRLACEAEFGPLELLPASLVR